MWRPILTISGDWRSAASVAVATNVARRPVGASDERVRNMTISRAWMNSVGCDVQDSVHDCTMPRSSTEKRIVSGGRRDEVDADMAALAAMRCCRKNAFVSPRRPARILTSRHGGLRHSLRRSRHDQHPIVILGDVLTRVREREMHGGTRRAGELIRLEREQIAIARDAQPHLFLGRG